MGIVATQTEGSSADVIYLNSDGSLRNDPDQSLSPSTSSSKVLPTLSSAISSAFLPTGYPSSVTPDYLSFQIWDTIQALSSYVRGMLSTQAMLTGIGVGSATATPASAVVQFFYRDAVGLLAGVLFAAIQGSSFDAYAKQWRLVADVANDIGLTAELAAPAFSSPGAFLLLACVGSICRAITGVAGGATRMALTQHFALQGNAADIAAKEGSQETAVTLLGMILGLGLTRVAARNAGAAWVAFVIMTVLHVYANMCAMRCLCITRLNSERLDIILGEYRETKKILTPMEVANLERLLPPFVSRWFSSGFIMMSYMIKQKNQQWDVVVAPDLSSLNIKTRKLVAESFSSTQNGEIVLRGDSSIKKARSIVITDPESKKIYVFIHQAGGDDDLRGSECRQVVQEYCKARSMTLQLDNTSSLKTNIREDKNNSGKLSIKEVAAVGGVDWVKLLREAGWCCDRPALSQGRVRLHWGDSNALMKKKSS
jgi:Vitamin B6 photo-protection and homoeostasis